MFTNRSQMSLGKRTPFLEVTQIPNDLVWNSRNVRG